MTSLALNRGRTRFDRSVAASPIWLKLLDAFTDQAPAGPLSVSLERRTGPNTWEPFTYPHKVTPAGDVGFVNLGRTGSPLASAPFDVRITITAPGTVAVGPTGDASVIRTVIPWAPEAPNHPASPTILRFYPGPAYPFPARVPLLSGVVVDQLGIPVPAARVWATTVVQGTPRTEEVRSGPLGDFRIPLRWADGPTDINAARAGQTAAITVSVPADLSTTQLITLT